MCKVRFCNTYCITNKTKYILAKSILQYGVARKTYKCIKFTALIMTINIQHSIECISYK